MKSKLEFLYYIIREKSENIKLHKHECHELVYYIIGSGSTQIGETKFEYSSNTFSITKPECLHDEVHNEDTEVLFIGFRFDSFPFELNSGVYKDRKQNVILGFMKQLKNELAKKQKYYELKLELLVKEMLVEIERINDSPQENKGDFSYIQKFLEENYNQPVDMEILAELSGYSYHHFRHLFKEKTGLSPVNYIIKKRISSAKYLLHQPDVSMKEISFECGFSTESQFSSMFKKWTGQTPSEFRQTNLSKK